MAAMAIPAFQTKSKRNIFLEEDDEGDHAQVETKNEPIGIISTNEEKKTPTKENGQGTQSVSLLGSSPLKQRKAKKPPTPKGAKTEGASSSFLSRLFGLVSGSNTKRRPPMKAKGVYYDSSTCDVSKESDRTLAIGENGEAEYIPDWIASNQEDHQRNVPVVVRRPEYDVYNEVDDRKLLKKIMTKARKLPQEPGKYASNHIMVNAERTTRNVPPVRRERHMDQIAREHAKLMAEERSLFQIATPRDLERLLKEKDADSGELPVFTRLGVNVGKGKSIAEAHRFMMAALAERNNIRDKRFSSMGMGTHQDKNGVLYLCQIFAG